MTGGTGTPISGNLQMSAGSSAGNGAYVDDIGMVQVELAHGAPHQVEDMAPLLRGFVESLETGPEMD